MLETEAYLTVAIYDHKTFIVQDTGTSGSCWSTLSGIMTLFHRVTEKMSELSRSELHLSDEESFNTLQIKVMITLISPELVSTSYNVAVSLCCVV